jgi:adhesin/invasin
MMSSRVDPTAQLVRILFAVAMTLAAAACSDSVTNTTPLIASSLLVNTASQGQTGTVGQPLAQAASVHVFDVNGFGVANTVVAWSVVSGGGSVDSATSTTDANGDATTHWTLGPMVGSDTLRASLGTGPSATLSATGVAGAMTQLVVASGDQQVITAGSATQPLVVKATDQYGNVVANADIAWSVAGGGTLSARLNVTDMNGLAQDILMTDSTPATYTVTAAGVNASVTFTVTAN